MAKENLEQKVSRIISKPLSVDEIDAMESGPDLSHWVEKTIAPQYLSEQMAWSEDPLSFRILLNYMVNFTNPRQEEPVTGFKLEYDGDTERWECTLAFWEASKGWGDTPEEALCKAGLKWAFRYVE